MDEANYPANSHVSKMRPSVPADPAKPSGEAERPNVEKAIEGTATVKRKSIGSRFSAIFTQVSFKEVVNDVVDEVIIPGTKGLLHDMGNRVLDRFFGAMPGRPNGAARTMMTSAAQVAYNKFSQPTVAVRPDFNKPPMPMTRRGQAIFDFEEIEFQTRKDASIILDLMYDRMQNYGSVSVAEFYGWADVQGNFTDRNYGWRDLTGAGPTRARNGLYVLNLPVPVPLT